MVFGHAVNHFLNQNGLTNTGSTEKTNLSTLNIGGKQVNDLDAGLKHLSLALKLIEAWWSAVNWPALLDLDLFTLLGIEHLTGDIKNLTLGDISNWNGNWCSSVTNLLTANQSIGWLQSNCANQVITEVLRDLQG